MKVNSKEVKLALRSILSTKAGEDAIVVVKPFEFDKPSTKQAAEAIKALKLDGQKITLVVSDDDVNTYLSFRNIPEVEVLPVNSINAYDLVDNKKLVIQDNCLGYIEEVLA